MHAIDVARVICSAALGLGMVIAVAFVAAAICLPSPNNRGPR